MPKSSMTHSKRLAYVAEKKNASRSENHSRALIYVNHGVRIFPCNPEKRPIVNDWFNAASVDPNKINEWWTLNPDALIAIPMKGVDCFAIDCDRHNKDEDGVALFANMIAGNDALPEHPIIHTPNRGEHHIFKQPADKIGNKIIAPGIETRGYKLDNDGGYIIAPGTVLPDGRGWNLADGSPSFLKSLDADSIPQASQWVIDKLRDKPKPEFNGAHLDRHEAGKREHAYAAKALDNIADEVAATGQGERNNKLNAAAFTMGTMVARDWIGRATTEGRLYDACAANGLLREDGAHAVTSTIKSGIEAGLQHPHAPLMDRPLEPSPRTETPQETKPQGVKDRLANFVFSGDEPPAPQAMLIDGVMPLQGLPFIGGQSSAGKTFIAAMLACCAASGKEFMGREVKQRVGSVIVAAEGRPMLAARITAALNTLGVTERVPVSWIKQVPDFSRPEAIKEFIEDLRAMSAHYQSEFDIPLGLVFVDTVSASFDIKEEADNAEAARVCKIMRSIADSIGVVIVPIHHYGKNAGVGLRGASAWRANADFVLSVMADIDPQTGNVTNRQLAIAKDRDGAQGPLTPFALVRVDLGIDEEGKAWGSLAAVAGESGQPVTQWPEHLRIIRQALSTALVNHGKKERPYTEGPEVTAVAEYAVREEFDRIAHVDSPPEKQHEALRKQFSRKLNAAQSKGLIALHRDKDGHAIIWFVSGKEASGGDPETKSVS